MANTTYSDTQPPSNKWIVYKNRRQLWEAMVKIHGTSIDKLAANGELSDFDKGLIKEFGNYKNDPTRGHFRCKDGSTIEPGDEEFVEVSLFQSSPDSGSSSGKTD